MTRRRRLTAGLAVLALTLGLVVAGSFSAQAQASSIAFTTASPLDVTAANPTIEGTVTWTTSGGAITLYIVEPDGTIRPDEPCDVLGITETDWSCSVALPVGENSVRAYATADDDPGFPISTANALQITVGSTSAVAITAPAPDVFISSTTPAFTGTGPAMGEVRVQARAELQPGDPFVDVCVTDVDRFGDWSCATTFPDYDRYTVRATGVTNTSIGVGPAADQNLTLDPPKPGAVVQAEPGFLSATATSAAGQDSGVTWRYFAADGSPQETLDHCPETWSGDPSTPPDGGAIVACEVSSALRPGLYLASSNAYANDALSLDRGDLTRVPATPVLDAIVPASDGWVAASGTIDLEFDSPFTVNEGQVLVDVSTVGGQRICTAIPAVDGTWACDAPAPGGTQSFYAYGYTQGFSAGGGTLDGYHNGFSETSNLVGATVPAATHLAITTPLDGSSQPYAPDPFEIRGTSPFSTPVDVEVRVDGALYDTCDALTVVEGEWGCNLPSSPVPPVGHYTLSVSQPGSQTATAAVTRREATPELYGYYFEFVEGAEDGYTFSGQVLSTGSTRVEIVGEDLGCTAAPQAFGDWSCQIDLSGLPVGPYVLEIQNYTPGDPTLDSTLVTASVDIVPLDYGPQLDCVFSPAGVVISSPDDLMIDLYTVTPIMGDVSASWVQGYCNGDIGIPLNSADGWDYEHLDIDCSAGCTLTDLAPGIYDVYYSDGEGGTGGSEGEGEGSVWRDYYFRVPETPTFTTAASAGGLGFASGGGATAGNTVVVTDGGGATICSAVAEGDGRWACSFTLSTASTGRAYQVDEQSGGMSAYTAFRALPVAPPVVEPPATPVAGPVPVLPAPQVPLAVITWLLNFDGDLNDLKPGDRFTLSVSGMPEGTAIEVWMHSTPRLLGTATGTGLPMSMELTVPDDIENGAHEIEMIATTPLGTRYFYRSDATVSGGVDPAAVPTAEPGDGEDGEEDGAGGAHVDRSDPAAPSALSASIAPLDRIVSNPVAIAIAGGLALALLFLVALPTELLNSSLSSNTSRLGRAYGAVDGALNAAQDWFIRVTRSRALAAGLLTVLVALVYGFVDPGFGFDLVSLRLVLSLALAFFILSYGASWLSGLVIRRVWGTSGVIALQPSIILFAVVGVVVARILDFSPGFLVGIAIGLELIAASRRVSARAVLVQFGFVVGLALAAWVVYSLFVPGDDFAGMLVEDTLVAVTAEGLTGALIAVFPLQFMDGRELWLESKRLWAAVFLAVAVPFSLLVLPTAIEGTEVGDYGIWLLVFAVFGLVSVAIWFVFARAAKREEEAAETETVDA